jgi:hypothetical protein
MIEYIKILEQLANSLHQPIDDIKFRNALSPDNAKNMDFKAQPLAHNTTVTIY